jgi:hypothetical protein
MALSQFLDVDMLGEEERRRRRFARLNDLYPEARVISGGYPGGRQASAWDVLEAHRASREPVDVEARFVDDDRAVVSPPVGAPAAGAAGPPGPLGAPGGFDIPSRAAIMAPIGGKRPNVADEIADAGKETPSVVATGTSEQDVRKQLSDQGVSPDSADLITFRDGESGHWQAVRMARSSPLTDDQLADVRYREAFDSIQLEIGKRNEQIDKDLRELRYLHSGQMQDFDRAIMATADPSERAIYVQSKANAVRAYQQAMGQKQRERDHINLAGQELMSAYATDRYRTGTRTADDQMAIDSARHEQKMERDQQVAKMRHQDAMQRLSREYGLRMDKLMADTHVEALNDRMTRALDEYYDKKGYDTKAGDAALSEYNKWKKELDTYLQGLKQREAEGAPSGVKTTRTGAPPVGPPGGKAGAVFTTSNGAKIVNDDGRMRVDFPDGMSAAEKAKAAAEIRAWRSGG